MKNIYGLNNNGILTHIDDVNKGNVDKHFCLQCGDELIARKGKVNRHHFSHKNKIECNYETYLHKLGKLKFFNQYKNCLKNKIPFYANYEKINICNTCNSSETYNLNCHLNTETGKVDLTTIFDQIFIEKSHDGFIADILLKSTKREEVVFIEIWVTHSCELEKIKSGHRIVEIKLNNEDDLTFLNDNHIHQGISNCCFYNFKTPTIKKSFVQIHECYQLVNLFMIFKSGKGVSKGVLRKNIEGEKERTDVIYYKVENYDGSGEFYANNNFIENIEEASRKGVKFKNCFACRFWTTNTHYFGYGGIFCKRLKKLIPNSNDGNNCDKFWRIE